jgi:hypothetical protein
MVAVWSSTTACWNDVEMLSIEITDDARQLLERKGGTMSIDFIRPTG